jgi:hypothetical protein
MVSQEDVTRLAALREPWRRWTAVVELFARRRAARHRVDPGEYHRLHREVLETCERLAGSAEGDSRALGEGLAGLARPWLTPWVLDRADREILFDLLQRCRQAEEKLGGRPRARAAWRWAALGLLGVVALALVAVPPGWSWHSLLGQGRSWSDVAGAAIKRSSPSDRLFAAGAVVTVVTVFLVSRASRRA